MLNMEKVELELISYADMYLSFEKGMRGGISYISKRYNKANNKFCYICFCVLFNMLYTYILEVRIKT